jgi:hypothetical protein
MGAPPARRLLLLARASSCPPAPAMGAPPAGIWRRSRRPGGAHRGGEATAPSVAASLSGGVCGALEARPPRQGGLLPTASLHRPSPL